MTTSTASQYSLMDAGIDTLKRARNTTLRCVEELTPEQMLHRPGGNCNPAAWILGHIAYSESSMVAGFTQSDDPLADWKDTFNYGTEPSDNASDYPSKAELLDALEGSQKRAIAFFTGIPEERYGEPMPER